VALAPDELVRTLTADGSAAVRALAATRLVRHAAERHRTSPSASVALGRALMGTLLLAAEGKRGERLQLRVRGDGPLGSITVTAESDGRVRGYLQHPGANPPLRGPHLGVCDGIGSGTLSVERNHPSWKHPYSGIVPLHSGEIAQDLARYLLDSEQKPSAVALGIYLSPDGEIEAAGGYLVQSLPGADPGALAALEHRVAETASPSELIRDGATAGLLLERLLEGRPFGDVERLAPRFVCPCDRERVRRAALLLGREEIREIAEAREELEVRCAFCAEIYRLSPSEVRRLASDA
jgi:molecular chaperone Hsp33